MIVYIIEEWGGSYDTSYTKPLPIGFTSEEKAQDYINELTKDHDFLNSSIELMESIQEVLDNYTPEDDELDTWYDSEDIFIEELKKHMPSVYKTYSKDQLRKLHHFYKYDVYDGLPTYHITEINIQ